MTARNISSFRPAAELVASRDREEALRAMIPRLLDMHERAKALGTNHHVFGDGTLLFSSSEHVSMPGAVYVDVRVAMSSPAEIAVGPKVFSAWLNCPASWPGKYQDGAVHVMAWRRGWERALTDMPRGLQ
jgi:hypothetical protein